MSKRKPNPLSPDAPLLHENHKKPVTRRDFLGAGLISGSAMVMGPTIMSLVASAQAKAATRSSCGITTPGAAKIPFICFDLGGGASMTGSNVLVGGPGGQLDFLSTAGYSKLGLPPDFLPNVARDAQTDQINTELGLAFHSDSAFLRGIRSRFTTNIGSTNGAIIPARSDNDTGDNPHNPMYGINRAGADGELLTLIGTRNSDSGGRSVAPADMIDPAVRPTKIDRPSDSTGLVDTGSLSQSLVPEQAAVVMQTIERLSMKKINHTTRAPAAIVDDVVKELVHCGYLKTTDTVARFGNPAEFDPTLDPNILSALGKAQGETFSTNERKTASVMNLVIKGYAGAGTIELGGYDYHNSTRATGENRDFEAGRLMGACLEFAALEGKPLMLYVFTDGSLASNGTIDTSEAGGDKGVWTGDNSSTSAAFFLVYNPGSQPVLMSTPGQDQFQHQQLGYFRSSGSVETAGTTPGANNVNLLVEMVILNYMALHGEQNQFATVFPNHGLGSDLDKYIAFEAIVNGTIG